MSEPLLKRIGQIAIVAHDVERATAFYRDVLGLRFLFSAPPGLAFFDCGRTRLMLSAPESPEHDHPGSVIYFDVEDIHAAYDALASRGTRFIDAPHAIANLGTHTLWMTFFHDTEENVLALMSEVENQNH